MRSWDPQDDQDALGSRERHDGFFGHPDFFADVDEDEDLERGPRDGAAGVSGAASSPEEAVPPRSENLSDVDRRRLLDRAELAPLGAILEALL